MENNDVNEGIVNPTNQADPNPAKIFIQWKSKNECFIYYSKEKKENVDLKLPFSFIPLYRCETLKGYNHKKGKTFIANEVIKLNDSPVVLKSYNNKTKEKKVEASGMYPEFKDGLDQAVKFTISMYAALKNKKGELSLVNVQLNGAGVHHWFDFENNNKIWGKAIEVSDFTEEANGDVDYKAPVFKTKDITPEESARCRVLQKEIITYLEGYFAKNGNIPQNNPVNSSSSASSKESSNSSNSNPVFTGNDYGNDDDLPF